MGERRTALWGESDDDKAIGVRSKLFQQARGSLLFDQYGLSARKTTNTGQTVVQRDRRFLMLILLHLRTKNISTSFVG